MPFLYLSKAYFNCMSSITIIFLIPVYKRCENIDTGMGTQNHNKPFSGLNHMKLEISNLCCSRDQIVINYVS